MKYVGVAPALIYLYKYGIKTRYLVTIISRVFIMCGIYDNLKKVGRDLISLDVFQILNVTVVFDTVTILSNTKPWNGGRI